MPNKRQNLVRDQGSEVQTLSPRPIFICSLRRGRSRQRAALCRSLCRNRCAHGAVFLLGAVFVPPFVMKGEKLCQGKAVEPGRRCVRIYLLTNTNTGSDAIPFATTSRVLNPGSWLAGTSNQTELKSFDATAIVLGSCARLY